MLVGRLPPAAAGPQSKCAAVSIASPQVFLTRLIMFVCDHSSKKDTMCALRRLQRNAYVVLTDILMEQALYICWYLPNGIAPRHWALFAVPDHDLKTHGSVLQAS